MEKSRDFLTGVVFFVLMGVLGFFTIVLADVKFGDLPTRTVRFEAIEGLEKGHAVLIDGVRCGRVSEVLRPAGQREIDVVLEFDEEPTLFAGATFTIKSASLLGGRVLVIENLAGATAPLPAEELSGTVAGDPLAQAGKLLSDENIEKVEDILVHLDKRIMEVEEFTRALQEKGPALMENLNNRAEEIGEFTVALRDRGPVLLDNLNARAEEIQEFTAALGKQGPALLAKLNARADEIEGFTKSLSSEGPQILADTKATVAELRGMTAKIANEEGVGRVLLRDDPWIKFESAIAKVEEAADNVAIATGSLRRKDNIVGLLLTDPEMAMQLKRAMKALNDFLETQREDAPLTSFAGLLLTPF